MTESKTDKALAEFEGEVEVSVEEFALKCISTARKSSGMCIHDAIVATSIREDLNFHLGYYEYNQAKNTIIKLIRVPKDATVFDADGNGLNAVPRGEYNDLLGKKLFPDQDRGRTPLWAGHAKPRKAEKEPFVVTGRELPIVKTFLDRQKAMLLVGYDDDYTEEWIVRKVRAAPAVRDVDLKLASDSMEHRIELLKSTRHMQQQIADLNATVARLAAREFEPA